MCGICGKLNFDRGELISPASIKAMSDTIYHRGPDDEGYHVSGQIGFGFRRLSIIDLDKGHQPLSNEDGTVWIVFNGEIYNFLELRRSLLKQGHIFRSESDTEVIIHLYEEFGEDCVEQLRGMFAFAIWDARQETLFLARDRIGIKPLYYSRSNGAFLFASEIKAILSDRSTRYSADPAIIDRFLTFKYLPGDETGISNIFKLPAGSYLTVRRGMVTIKRYWDLTFAPSSLSYREAQEQLSSLLEETVRLHMISDVPVGFLLSGGFDSTALLSFASHPGRDQISSFTVGFSEPGIVDERWFAALAANHFGTRHHEMTISARDFQDSVPKYVWHMEEPVCEPPAIALHHVSQLARRSVKVLISGEGGDEAFGGYSTYRNFLWLSRLRRFLGPLRGTAASASLGFNRFLRSEAIAKYAPALAVSQPWYGGFSNAFGKDNQDFANLYTDEYRHTVDNQHSAAGLVQYLRTAPANDTVNRMLYIDAKTWLPDDLLLKADKMTMANSIELRVPFLDHKVMEFAASLPGSYKVRGLSTKRIAKGSLRRRVPAEILNRKKVGFPVPYESWLRKEMRDWLSDILLDRRTINRGYFNKRSMEALLAQTCVSGPRSKNLFSLAVLELWHRTFLEASMPLSNVPQELTCPVIK